MVKKKTINKGETKINMKKIAIIGSGSWGVALATYLANVGNQVKIWSFSEEERDLINNEKKCKYKCQFRHRLIFSPITCRIASWYFKIQKYK